MPFNSGGQSYQGGSFLFQGLASAGKSVADAMEELNKDRKLDSYNDLVIQHAYQAGQIGLEDYNKYIGSSRTQKTGIAAGIAANFVEDVKRQQLDAAKEAQTALAEERSQRAATFNWTPDEAAKAAAEATGNKLVQVGPGKVAVVPYGGSGQDQVVTDPLTISGQTIPGIGVNRKTGQYVYFGGLQQGGGVQVHVDPKTNLPYYLDERGKPHFLTTQQVMAGNMLPQQGGTPPPAQGGGVGSEINRILQSIFPSGMTGPFKSASPTPAPSAAPAGGESLPVETPAPAAAVAPMPAAKVKVKSPDGKLYYLPVSQLDAALRQGYTRVQ